MFGTSFAFVFKHETLDINLFTSIVTLVTQVELVFDLNLTLKSNLTHNRLIVLFILIFKFHPKRSLQVKKLLKERSNFELYIASNFLLGVDFILNLKLKVNLSDT